MPGGAAGDAGGKLKAVATRWASGRGGRAVQADDAATVAAGNAIAAIEARRAGRRPAGAEDVEIGPEEADAVTLFYGLGSQWRVHAMSGVRLGLDYAAVPVTAQMMGIGMSPQLFEDIRVMEGAALVAFAAR